MIVGGVQWEQRLRRLEQGLRTLPDKPEESPQAALRALWFLAAGTRLSVQAAAERQPPQLDAAQLQALDAWIDRRL